MARRSDRYWAGLSLDLIIEQVLMRNLKTSGGLTRRRGVTEQQRLTWLLSKPVCVNVNCAMQGLTGVSYNTAEQNKDITKARQARDWKRRYPQNSQVSSRYEPLHFQHQSRKHLYRRAHSTINVDKAKDVGNAILVRKKGKTAAEYNLRRKTGSSL